MSPHHGCFFHSNGRGVNGWKRTQFGSGWNVRVSCRTIAKRYCLRETSFMMKMFGKTGTLAGLMAQGFGVV